MSDRDRPKTHRVLLFAILLVGILGVASLLEIHPLPKKKKNVWKFITKEFYVIA
jgi:hypothetical protein